MIKSIVLVISLIVSLSMFVVVFFSKQMFKGTRKVKTPVEFAQIFQGNEGLRQNVTKEVLYRI